MRLCQSLLSAALSAALLLTATGLVSAQIHIQEDFSDGMPPTGWSIDAHASNWSANDSNNAGSDAPEAMFNYSPTFTGQSRIISPEIDLTGNQMLSLRFLHMLDHYGDNYEIGVATRSGNGAWNTIWSIVNPGGNVTEVVTLNIDNGDISAEDFQICWYFDGYSYNLDYWYIDDITLYTPQEHDVATASIDIESQYEPGGVIYPEATAFNNGLNTESFDIECQIVNWDQEVLYTNTVSISDLDPGTSEVITFTAFFLEAADELYQVAVTTLLDGDMEPSNDAMERYCNTYTTPRELVILEIGTGTWCTYCPGAAMGAEDLIDNGQQVGVVEYHSGDSYENSYSTDRIDYYGIGGFPTAVFDGVEYFVGGSHTQSMYSNYLPLYNGRIVVNSAFEMEITGEMDRDDDYTVQVHVTRHAPVMSNNMVLHLTLTESGIDENWQDQDHLSYVERLMAPGSDGTGLDLNGEEEVVLEFTINSSWVTAECELVAFIQDLDSKEIQQGIKVMVTELESEGVSDVAQTPQSTALGINYPNPFNPSTSITYDIVQPGPVSLVVYNIVGEKVATLVDELQISGNYEVTFDAGHLPSGLYFYQLTTVEFDATRKMMLVK
jgi:hypothetical protein